MADDRHGRLGSLDDPGSQTSHALQKRRLRLARVRVAPRGTPLFFSFGTRRTRRRPPPRRGVVVARQRRKVAQTREARFERRPRRADVGREVHALRGERERDGSRAAGEVLAERELRRLLRQKTLRDTSSHVVGRSRQAVTSVPPQLEEDEDDDSGRLASARVSGDDATSRSPPPGWRGSTSLATRSRNAAACARPRDVSGASRMFGSRKLRDPHGCRPAGKRSSVHAIGRFERWCATLILQ